MSTRQSLRCTCVAIAAVVCAALASASAFAQSKPADKPLVVGGTYEGWIRGSSQGDAATTVTLVQNGAALTGTMDAASYHFTIDGKVEGDYVSWTFTSGDISGWVAGTFKAGTIDGKWNAMGSESGTIELKRTAAK